LVLAGPRSHALVNKKKKNNTEVEGKRGREIQFRAEKEKENCVQGGTFLGAIVPYDTREEG